MPARPLTGLTVLDFTRVYSGPYATLLLSDLGAEVIKVEHPAGGDDSRSFGPLVGGTSGYFETLNRGKRSLAVDYRAPEGQALLRQLAAQVDVLVENFRPGQMARYGLDAETLRPACPRLVYVSINGFGSTGPAAGRGCYDVVAQAEGGLMGLTGLPDLPLKTGPAIADALSGLTAAVGLLGALWGRERSGVGAHVEVAMVDAVFACLENALAVYSVTGEVPARQGNADTVLAPFDAFAAADGWVVIGVGNDRLWQQLAMLVGGGLGDDPRFATQAGRVAHYAALRPRLADWCRTQPAVALLARLHAAGIPAGRVRSLDELAVDPRLEARGMLAHLTLDDGTALLVPGSPIQIAGAEPPHLERGPRLGEQTRAILSARLGLTEAELARLAAAGVIGGVAAAIEPTKGEA